ncbi:hypothetical protein TNCV_1749881 [Trichonephila clavipes]|nr:hypothetical protein TNCV_1749881 [Trichonephila clavipes]
MKFNSRFQQPIRRKDQESVTMRSSPYSVDGPGIFVRQHLHHEDGRLVIWCGHVGDSYLGFHSLPRHGCRRCNASRAGRLSHGEARPLQARSVQHPLLLLGRGPAQEAHIRGAGQAAGQTAGR